MTNFTFVISRRALNPELRGANIPYKGGTELYKSFLKT